MSKNASDLISRKAVCDMLHDEMEAWGSCADEIEALLKANDALFKIPAVDAVEVVRCKDCKYCEKMLGDAEDGFWGCLYHREAVEPNDFCSYGERKDGA